MMHKFFLGVATGNTQIFFIIDNLFLYLSVVPYRANEEHP